MGHLTALSPKQWLGFITLLCVVFYATYETTMYVRSLIRDIILKRAERAETLK